MNDIDEGRRFLPAFLASNGVSWTHLMNDGDFLAAVGPGVIEGVPTEALRVLFRHDLQALDDARDVLVLQHGVLALSVLSQRGENGYQ